MQPLPFSPAAVPVPFPFSLQSPVALLPLFLSDASCLPPAPHRGRAFSSPDSLTRSERERLYAQMQARLSRAEEDRREREDEQQLSSIRAAVAADDANSVTLTHSPFTSIYAAAAQPRVSPAFVRRSPAGDGRRMSMPPQALAGWVAAGRKDEAAGDEREERTKAAKDDDDRESQPAADGSTAEAAEEKEEEPLPRSSSLLTSSLLASLSLQKQASASAALPTSEYRPSSAAPSAVVSPSSSAPSHTRSLSSFSFLTNRRASSPPPHSRAAPTFLDYLHAARQQQTADASQQHHLPYLDYSSLPALVTAITSSTATASRAAFLLTFPYFCDAATLADLLLCALFSPPPVDLTGRDRELGETEKKLMTAWRREKDDVLLTLQQWVIDFAEDVAGAGGIGGEVVTVLRGWPPEDWRQRIVDGMRETRERVVCCWEQEMEQWEERRGKERLAAATDELQQSDRLTHPLLSPLHFSLTAYTPSPFSLSSSLYNFSSMIIAQQLTLLTLDRLAAIQPRQLIAKQRVSLPPALNQMKLSNQTTLFIASHILALHPSLPSTPSHSTSASASVSSSSSSALRLSIFRKWIKVACILFAHCNWNGVFEVMYGLTHHAVYRLRLAHQLQREERENYSKLTTFVSSDDNYGVYRRVRAKKAKTVTAGGAAADAVRLPYLGVVLKDLVAMEESQLVVRVEAEKADDSRKRKQDDARAATRGGMADRGSTGGIAVVSNGMQPLQPLPASSPSVPFPRGPLLSVSSTTRCGASMSSESSLSSVNSIASSDSSSGSINVDSVESDLFGDDSSGSLVLPTLLSASLQSPPSAFTLPAAAASNSVLNSSPSAPGAPLPALSPSPPPPLSPSRVFVNFTKCRQIHSLITETLQLPSRPPFPPLPDVQRMLTQGSEAALSEKQLMDMSLLIQPRSGKAAGDAGGGVGSGGGEAGTGAERGGGMVVRRSGSPFSLLSLTGHLTDGLHALRDLSPAALSSPMRPLRGSASSSAIHSLLHHR